MKASTRLLQPGSRHHRIRRTLQYGTLLMLAVLPFTGWLHFDRSRSQFLLLGERIGWNEYGLLALVSCFLLLLALSTAIIYGRFFCGYICPQMTLSELANRAEQRWGRMGVLGFSLVSAATLGVLAWLWGGRVLDFAVIAAGMGLLLDLLFVRQRFCVTLCPYGALQRRLADPHTLQVIFTDHKGQCVSCDSCARACPVGLDIRQGASQPGCSACGECMDACRRVSAPEGRTAAIYYAWGQKPIGDHQEGLLARLGLRDGKRLLLLTALAASALALSVALHLRVP
jgi:polyferredoxin